MKGKKRKEDFFETRIEKTTILFILLGMFFLIIGQYIFAGLFFIAIAYSCYIFLQHGLLSIYFTNDRIQYRCMHKFRICVGELLQSELDESSLVLTRKMTGSNSYEELLFFQDKEILFRDSELGFRNLSKNRKSALIKRMEQLISK
ncbi:hypothetical protein HX004_07850 [Myroides sp. 1354]|uniref:hypothetical protein n=1 Tax=unclassified Myroides TaxID=2642485 RepID=UPI0025786B0E|nr:MULTISPECIES: hypothetical protein [unclassified Myroides]MDM1044974.1 hypothetical protein [Myroides sp. R163-1]MDM1055687.1 hypothetical protein [Myroides sp. 1354]MDM1068984.1 hypothetical protein [Myroides sp. 1372]